MDNIITVLFYPLPNAIMSGFMAVILVYWLISFLGANFDDIGVDFDSNVHVDIGTDVDIDASVEGDAPLETNVSGDSTFIGILKFMNAGKVPFMIILTCLFFFTWAGSLILTHLIPMSSWGWLSVLILVPLLIIGGIFTKIITTPLISFLNKTGYHGEKEINFFGEAGKMLSSIEGDKVGLAEFIIENNPIRLYVVSVNGDSLSYGDTIIVTERKRDQKTYFVTKNF